MAQPNQHVADPCVVIFQDYFHLVFAHTVSASGDAPYCRCSFGAHLRSHAAHSYESGSLLFGSDDGFEYCGTATGCCCCS